MYKYVKRESLRRGGGEGSRGRGKGREGGGRKNMKEMKEFYLNYKDNSPNVTFM